MKALFKNILMASFFILAIASPVMTVMTPQTAHAASCERRVLGIPPWYRGLTNNNPPECTIKTPEQTKGIETFVWRIVLNVVEMAVVIVAYISVFFILYGGFLYMTGGALPAQLERARKTITNALIGLVIAMAAIALNNLIFGIITR